MLVLGRRQQQKIFCIVGDTRIAITVCEIQKGKVRLGFEAPENVTILREEVSTCKPQ